MPNGSTQSNSSVSCHPTQRSRPYDFVALVGRA
jgi:hypothetical protein